MIVVRVHPDTVPAGKDWPGWFTWDGQHLAHLTGPVTPKGGQEVNNGNQIMAACGQKTPAAITYDQYLSMKAGK